MQPKTIIYYTTMVLCINIHCNTSIIYPRLPTSVQPISITKILLIQKFNKIDECRRDPLIQT
jgi:hypothetical protein